MIKKPLLFVFSAFSSLLLVAVAQPVLAATANMAVTVTGSYVPYPNPTKNTAPALYAVTVTNSGPDAATNVVVNSTAASPTKPVYFQSQAPSQGSCAGVSGSICNLGTIADRKSVV